MRHITGGLFAYIVWLSDWMNWLSSEFVLIYRANSLFECSEMFIDWWGCITMECLAHDYKQGEMKINLLYLERACLI